MIFHDVQFVDQPERVEVIYPLNRYNMYVHLTLWLIASVVLISGGRLSRIMLIEIVDFMTD